MEILIISSAAFFVAILTFFSGFGLGTLLTPVFVLFFPAELAIALTGVVHFLNNIFKLFLVGRKANKEVLLRFGIPAVIAAFAGSWVLFNISGLEPLASYNAFGRHFEIFPIKLIIAILLIIFVGIDLIPFFKTLQFGIEKLAIGGAISGFFGGLSGHQGALRSAFLIKAGLSKETFIGTAVVVSAFVDFTRLSVYATRITTSGLMDNLSLVLIATTAAIAGAYTGNMLLKKITLHFVQVTIAILLVFISLALGAGLI